MTRAARTSGKARLGRSRSLRDDDGAALVEFAIVMPILFMLVFGLLTGGIVMNRQMSLSHSTREAARYGATVPLEQFPTAAEWADHVQSVGVERSGGELAAANLCVALVDGSSVQASTNPGLPCIADDINTGRRVQVTASLPDQEINGILVRVPLTLTSDATAMHEE